MKKPRLFPGKWRRSLLTRSGFTLIEVVIAIAVVSLTFIGLIGLLGVGSASDQTSSQQIQGTAIASSILTDLRSTPGDVAAAGKYAPLAASPRFSIAIPTADNTTAAPLAAGATGLVVASLYFDNSGLYLQTGGVVPANAVYQANVYVQQLSHIGNGAPPSLGISQYNDMARIVVWWPAQIPANTSPAGSVETIAQFTLH